MRISLIAAMAENRVIGRDGGLPWHLPGDFKYFREKTMGKPYVMGRKSFDSIGKALPGRTNIVVTRNPDFRAENVITVNSLADALATARQVAEKDDVDEIMIGGGAAIYTEALPLADRIYLTEVHATVDGDTRFPDFGPDTWREVSREDVSPGEKDPMPYSFVVYDRIKQNGD